MSLATMRAFGLAFLMVVLPLTLADPVVVLDHSARGEHFVRQDTDLPTGTNMDAPPTSTPLVLFHPMDEFTTCTPAIITWTAGGPKAPVTITITQAGVIQSGAPSSGPGTTGKTETNTFSNIATGLGRRATSGDVPPLVTVVQSVNSMLERYTWDSVNVTQGWYQFIAQTGDKQVVGRSGQDVFVRNGTNTSCLGGASSSSTQSNPTSTSQSDQPSETNTGSPTGAIESKQLNVGAVVGGIIGGAALLALLALAGCCMRKRSNRRTSATTSNGGQGGANGGGYRAGLLPFGKWGKLGSGSFNDKDRAPTVGHADDTVHGNVLSAPNIGRPQSRSATRVGFFAGVLKSPSPHSPKRATAPPSSKKKQSRHNSHTESIGGMLSSSATTSMTGSSALHGIDDDFLYSYERHVPMSPISAGGSSVASSVRNPGTTGAIRSPFSDPSDNDSDSVVYGLYGTSRNSNTGVIPIGYDGPSISSGAPTPSPVPSYMYESSTGAVAGHSSDSDPPSRRNSRGHPDRLYPYTSFRDGRDQQDRVRTNTYSGAMYNHPNSHQQSLPETPRNDSLLTFTSSTSSGGGSKQGKNRYSKSMHESNASPSELYDLSTTSSPQTPSLPTPTAVQASPSLESASVNMSSGNPAGGTFGASAAKRTARKPVPSYSPDDFTTSVSAAGGSPSAFSSSASSPTKVSPLTTVDGVVSEGQREVFRQHELLHKDSTGSMKGGTKMHVLMPDMPPPQRH